MVELTVKERAACAKQILDNPLFSQIFQEFKEELTEIWVSSGSNDIERREFVWKYIKALEQIKGRMDKILIDAKVETAMEKQREKGKLPSDRENLEDEQ